ncbi:MAG TPA: dTDP-4-dehydrorhamnose 3,5-epimerase [Cytophagales bacterium]|nr:dTDP-4-dehydrorhamnose 3,5-epimerase [Cytophagales bacterium]HAA18383.1 dTDP-4-dehydrorhamnose 3,5-epimerase [Cytophagales bacterium]HAP61430.1 dTDP-4-dehydrorhamnose 3,5-epimerase [Cytophagales bacterium]
MQVEKSPLAGCLVLTPRIFNDHRGWFIESFNQKTWDEALGQEMNWVQDNHSVSHRGVLRGLHFQNGEFAQAKLVRVVQGEVIDIAVDLRKDSPTYKQSFATRLSADNQRQIFVPRGFGHGFVALQENTVLLYKCDNYYAPQAEGGIRFDDPDLNLDWGLPHDELILSDKDLKLPSLKEWENG